MCLLKMCMIYTINGDSRRDLNYVAMSHKFSIEMPTIFSFCALRLGN